MDDAQRVMIYATGSDMQLREMCWALLGSGWVFHADLLDRASIYLENGDTPKVSSSGRAVMVVCNHEHLEKVMQLMRTAYMDDDLSAFAVPVLASIAPA